MPWLALTLQVERTAAEAFSDALLEAGAQSVWLEAGRVCAILEPQQDPRAVITAAAQAAGMTGKLTRDMLCFGQEQED